MDNNFVSFGDVFRHKEEEYVYLLGTDETIYAARIITEKETKKLERVYNYKSKQKQNTDMPVFCYVVLETEDFRDRAAHLHKADDNVRSPSFDIIGKLNQRDLKRIKKEIEENGGHVSLELKNKISDISLD